MTYGRMGFLWRRKHGIVTYLKRNQAPDNEEEKVPVREGHETTLTDHEISEYFNRDRFPLYGLRCDFETCRESLKELLKDDKEALQIISDATSYQDLIKRLIRHPADVHSPRGQALRNATGLHPVFLDWIAEPYWENGQFPFFTFPENEFALWEEYKQG